MHDINSGGGVFTARWDPPTQRDAGCTSCLHERPSPRRWSDERTNGLTRLTPAENFSEILRSPVRGTLARPCFVSF
jgi:hypothetical protein